MKFNLYYNQINNLIILQNQSILRKILEIYIKILK